VVVPFSYQVMLQTINYLDINLPAEKQPFLNHDPSLAPYQPVSRLPFAYYSNEFVLMAAPRGFVTGFLIDQADRVRAAFRTDIPDCIVPIHRTSALTSGGSRILYIDTGEIFTYQTNVKYFVQKNPRWIIPLLHDAIRHRRFDFASLLSNEVLEVYWNGEVFNELLLLALNGQEQNLMFIHRVCSTFAKPRFFRDALGLFDTYDPVRPPGEKVRTVDPIYNFREVESKASHIEWFSGAISDMNAFYTRVL
jgi:hypothetical protein